MGVAPTILLLWERSYLHGFCHGFTVRFLSLATNNQCITGTGVCSALFRLVNTVAKFSRETFFYLNPHIFGCLFHRLIVCGTKIAPSVKQRQRLGRTAAFVPNYDAKSIVWVIKVTVVWNKAAVDIFSGLAFISETTFFVR